MSWHARVLGPDDADAWAAVRLEALQLYPQNFLTTAAEFAARGVGDHRALLAQGKSWGLFGGELAGIAGFIPAPQAAAAHRAEIGAFYVRPSYHGSGAADALMRALIDHARAKGIWQLELYVADTNPRGQRFYARHGFTPEGRLPNAALIDGVMTTDIFMVADLR